MKMWLVPNHYCIELTSAMKEADVRHDLPEKRNVVENTELLLNFQVLKEPNKTECTINLDSIQKIYVPPLLPSLCSEYMIEEERSSFLLLNVVFHLTKYGCSGKTPLLSKYLVALPVVRRLFQNLLDMLKEFQWEISMSKYWSCSLH